MFKFFLLLLKSSEMTNFYELFSLNKEDSLGDRLMVKYISQNISNWEVPSFASYIVKNLTNTILHS